MQLSNFPLFSSTPPRRRAKDYSPRIPSSTSIASDQLRRAGVGGGGGRTENPQPPTFPCSWRIKTRVRRAQREIMSLRLRASVEFAGSFLSPSASSFSQLSSRATRGLKRCLRESQMHYQLYLPEEAAPRRIRLPFISLYLLAPRPGLLSFLGFSRTGGCCLSILRACLFS